MSSLDGPLAGFQPGARAARRARIGILQWVAWYAELAGGMLVFYVLLTPVWIGLRWAAWIAEFRARRRRPSPSP